MRVIYYVGLKTYVEFGHFNAQYVNAELNAASKIKRNFYRRKYTKKYSLIQLVTFA